MNNNTTQSKSIDTNKIANDALMAAENIGNELRASVQHVGAAFKDAGSAVSCEVGSMAEKAYNSLVSTGETSAKQVERTVRDSPLLTIGIAFGVGVIASALFFQRQMK
jgi:ElaB/YqjD/DUF883 family membrane-anchored ribosome-binding protein